MSYLEEFQKKIDRDDYPGFLVLWEEYCSSDEVDAHELELVLKRILESRFAARFGQVAETALLPWEMVSDEEEAFRILRLITDLQTTNSHELSDTIYEVLEKRYGDQDYFNDKIRMIGLRSTGSFQGAIRGFELLTHLDKGRFVYHTSGWGTGEIIELSLIREELVIEFEGVPGRRSLSFENAFRNLEPLRDDHFLARRFGDPDLLEEEARKDPVSVIQLVLKDLGPKTAAELKEELCELVIPVDDWTKWWQAARSKVKKDTHIETPSSIREPFRLRIEEVTHVDRLKEELTTERDPSQVLLVIYNFLRDFPEIQKSDEARDFIRGKLHEVLALEDVTQSHRLQVDALLEELFGEEAGVSLKKGIKEVENLVAAINEIEIAALKKKALTAVRQARKDWQPLFLEFLFTVKQSGLRDYLLKELSVDSAKEALAKRIEVLLHKPMMQPQLFLWYFQKVMKQEKGVLYADKEGQYQFFESFLMLLHKLEGHPSSMRDLVKKMYGMIIADRYQMVRDILKGSPIEFAREFLLLITKAQAFTQHDIKILHALAEVAHPELSGIIEKEEPVDLTIWTTQEGFNKVHERIHQIGTVEMVQVAREIETAREHGDLRENAEYKAAQEKRSRLQSEMKMLSDQVNHARVLTDQDVNSNEVGVGTVVTLTDNEGKEQQYTLLGPWDANPEEGILSIQSRFAKTMSGLKKGATFEYNGKTYSVNDISSYFEQQVRS